MVQPIRQETFWDRPLRVVETPAARATDPVTSHIAAAEHTASGKRGSNVAAVIDLVRAAPGHTSAELSRHSRDLTRHEVARRLPEAETAGAVFKGAKRRCEVNGSLAMTWWPAA